jgi:hypothetical protein
MADSDNTVNIKVQAQVDNAVRELRRLGIVAEENFKRISKPSYESKGLGQEINAFKRQLLVEQGMAKEELARGLINPAQFKALGEEAKANFHKGMVGLLSELQPGDSKFFDKFIQITREMGGPINEKAVKEGTDKSLQHVNSFIQEASDRLRAGHASLRTQFASGLIDKREFDRQKILLDKLFNMEGVEFFKKNIESFSTQALTKLGESFKVIDPKKIKESQDAGLHLARDFITKLKETYGGVRGDLSQKLAQKVLNAEEFDRHIRIAKDKATDSIVKYINQLANEGQLSFAARTTLQEALFKISPTKVGRAVDEGLAEAKKALDKFEGEYRVKRAKIREGFQGVGGQENEANLIRQTSVAQSELNKKIMEQIEAQRKAGTLSDQALTKLTSGLKIVNPKTIAEARDQGLQMAENMLRPIENEFNRRMSEIALAATRKVNPISRREAARQQVGAATAKNEAVQQLVSDLGRNKNIELSTEAFNKLAGALVNVDTYGRNAHTSMHQLRSKIFDILGVLAAVHVIENAVGAVINAFNGLRQIGEEVAQEEGVARAFEKTAATLGASSRNILESAREATRGVVEDFELMRASNAAVSLQAVKSEEDLRKLMFAGRTMARVMGIDTTKGVNDLTIALARGSTRVLDNIGVILKQEQAQQIYAKQLGKTTEALTAQEKREAFAVVGLQKAYERAIQFGDSQETAAERVSRMNAQIANQTREFKEAIIETEAYQAVVTTMLRTLADEENGVLRWGKAVLALFDDIVTTTYGWLYTLNVANIAAAKVMKSVADMKGIISGEGTTDTQIGRLNDEIELLQAGIKDIGTAVTKGVMDPMAGVKAVDQIQAQIKVLEEQKRKIEEPIKVRPISEMFLDMYAPLEKTPMDNTHRMPLIDEEIDDQKEKLDQYSAYISRLISLLKNYTEQGRNTAQISGLLSKEYGHIVQESNKVVGATDEMAQKYAELQTQVREALDNITFDEFHDNAAAAVQRYRELIDMGITNQSAYDGVQGALRQVNNLLERQGGLTDENRVKALKLRNDAREALVDAPYRSLNREARTALDILDQLADTRMTGGEKFEEDLRRIAQALGDLRMTQKDMMTPEVDLGISKLSTEITRYFDAKPVTKLNNELNDTLGMLEAQRALGMDNNRNNLLLWDIEKRITEEIAKRGTSTSKLRTQLLQDKARIEAYRKAIVDGERNLLTSTLDLSKRGREGRIIDLNAQAEEYRRQGLSQVAIEQWVQANVAVLRREGLQDIETVSMDVASAIGDALFMIGSSVEDLNEKVSELAVNLLRAFANMAIQRGMERMFDSLAGVGSKTAEAGEGVVSGAAGSAAAGTASAAGGAASAAGASGVIGAAGIPGWALLAGGFAVTLLSGILSRTGRDSEEEQYRAHLRALRQSRQENLLNVTLVLPNTPINPRDPEWQQAILGTITAAQGTRRLGTVTTVGRN